VSFGAAFAGGGCGARCGKGVAGASGGAWRPGAIRRLASGKPTATVARRRKPQGEGVKLGLKGAKF